MKKISTFGVALALGGLMTIQACEIGVGYGYSDGYRHYGGRRGGWYPRHGRHYYGGHVRFANDDLQPLVSDPVDEAALLAQDYGIRPESATKILNVTTAKDASPALRAMGLDENDFAPLARLQMPSSVAVNRVAAALGEDPSKIQALMQDYISDMKAQ